MADNKVPEQLKPFLFTSSNQPKKRSRKPTVTFNTLVKLALNNKAREYVDFESIENGGPALLAARLVEMAIDGKQVVTLSDQAVELPLQAKDQLAAIKELLDRTEGKAVQKAPEVTDPVIANLKWIAGTQAAIDAAENMPFESLDTDK